MHCTIAERIAALLASCVFFLLASGCGSGDQTQKSPPPRPIVWFEVEAYEAEMRRRLPGVVQSVQRAQLSFEVGGKVESIPVEIGDSFEQGKVLAKLETASYRLQVEQARAALMQVQAVAAEARQDFDRQQQLVAGGFASEATLDQAQAAYNSATSRVASARSSLSIAQENLDDTQMTAPYAGKVSGRIVEPDQQVAPGQTVITVQGAGNALEVRVMVPETLIDAVRRGSTHPVTFPALPARAWEATVTEVGTDTGAGSTYPVMLLIHSAATMPRPGMTAEVGFHASGESVAPAGLLAIPVTAFLPVEGNTTVSFVYDADSGTVSRREVTIADLSGDKALVSAGLRVGEQIASQGLAFLSDGQSVDLLGRGTARSEQEDIGQNL